MAVYCRMLSRRLRAFNDLDTGIGGTVAALSLQVDELQRSIDAAHLEADERSARLRGDVAEADDRIGRLEMLLAGLEDIEEDMDPTPRPVQGDLIETAATVPSFRAARGHSEGRFQR